MLKKKSATKLPSQKLKDSKEPVAPIAAKRVEPKVKLRAFNIDSKIEKIKESSLPASQKREMIGKLLEKKNITQKGNRISFSVYANLKNIKDGIRPGMIAFAKQTKMATVQEWDEIFKDF